MSLLRQRQRRPSRPGRPRARLHAQRGLALVEITLALLVIAVATLGSVSWTLSGMNLDTENQEHAEARAALRGVLEGMQALPFDQLYVRFNDNPADDPDGAGTAPGNHFLLLRDQGTDLLKPLVKGVLGTVGSLLGGSSGTSGTSSATSADTPVRHQVLAIDVEMPVDADGLLTEVPGGVVGSDLIWDLDGNGVLEAGDRSTSYRVLPVKVRVSWKGTRGERSIEQVRLFTHRIRPEDTK
jgi:hypothetical protein